MKHHLGDFLDREGDYWTIIPNRDRYSYGIGDVPEGSKDITVITIGRDDENWERVFTFPNLEELTLHEPSKKQIDEFSKLTLLKRLRITHARLKSVEFISNLQNIEELVLEYVSGFSDLSPIKELAKLKSLHLENLRKVKNFSGLAGHVNLRYLRIDGTLDWKQPIEDFEFLSELRKMEVLSFGQIINKSDYPALLPATRLKNLKKLKIARNILSVNEYALLEVGLPGVEGAKWEACKKIAYSSIEMPRDDVRAHLSDEIIKSHHPEVRISYDGKRLINNPKEEWFEFLGKGAGRVKCSNPEAGDKCAEYSSKYELMKEEAKNIVNKGI